MKFFQLKYLYLSGVQMVGMRYFNGTQKQLLQFIEGLIALKSSNVTDCVDDSKMNEFEQFVVNEKSLTIDCRDVIVANSELFKRFYCGDCHWIKLHMPLNIFSYQKV